MVEETVVKDILTTEMIETGEELIRRLDQSSVVVNAGFWLYLPELNIWRLMIASPHVAKYGPKKVYQQIHSVLSKMPESLQRIALDDISAVENDYRLVTLLRKVVKTGGAISGIRFSKNMINGQFIEDSYIYRLT